ncbi:hypothetical protein TNCV_2120321 [Trichonephila clavipes]|nr:hypothetical protein TNCV_2120321 [Trichonephila clavipes]
MQVAGRNYPPTNKNTLIRALTEEWDKLPQQLLDNVVQKRQNWIQEWYNVLVSDESLFCREYSDSHGELEETTRGLLAFYTRIWALHMVGWSERHWIQTNTSLVWIDGSLKADSYIFTSCGCSLTSRPTKRHLPR